MKKLRIILGTTDTLITIGGVESSAVTKVEFAVIHTLICFPQRRFSQRRTVSHQSLRGSVAALAPKLTLLSTFLSNLLSPIPTHYPRPTRYNQDPYTAANTTSLGR